MKILSKTYGSIFFIFSFFCISIPIFSFASDSQQNINKFEEQVQSLFKTSCFSCHGQKQQLGGLRLDSRDAILRGGGRGSPIASGHPEQSLLLKAIDYSDKSLQMPPKGKLNEEQIALLTRWVKAAAEWPGGHKSQNLITHWAFLPIGKSTIPTVKHKAWVRTPIDAFILAKLEHQNLVPSRRADKRILVRRAAYDLTGLPPSPLEMDAFIKDTRRNAYEKLIDRLLASPRYGERWGRHWLDLAHYGDTHGYDKDTRRDNAWPYRDYVINSFNADMPYSRFIQEQIAGDVLFPLNSQALIATGFIAAGPWDAVGNLELKEGTVEKEKTRLLDRDDMAANTLATFDSMTVHCARCHDHKFDPIPQRDYYRLQAVFSGVERGDRPYESPERMKQRAVLTSRVASLTQDRDTLQKKIDSLGSPELIELDKKLELERFKLNSLPKIPGTASETNGYHSLISKTPDQIKWVQIDLGKSFPLSSVILFPARPVDFRDTPGFGFPARFRIEVSDTSDFIQKTNIVDCTKADDASLWDIPTLFQFQDVTARYVLITATKLWKRNYDFVFALGEVQVESNGRNVARGAIITARDSIEDGRWSAKYLVDGFDSRTSLPDYTSGSARDLLKQKLGYTLTIRTLLDEREKKHYALISQELLIALAALKKELKETLTELNHMLKPNQVFALVTHAPRPIWVLRRGDVEQHGELVRAGALSCVPGLNAVFALKDTDSEGDRRASLAKWISSQQNMLTWRSIVNRVWHYHFGKGIVDTPNDFGKNGSAPTHPELLDWLACYLLEHGQSLKQLHRIIMLSSVYMQSSEGNAAFEKLDSDNRLLWKMNRTRLDAEEIRDSVLAKAGTLNLKMGGPGYEVFKYTYDYSPRYDHFDLDKILSSSAWRRAVYCFQVRSVQNPFLECLDCADPNINTPVRNTTLTALQALIMWNDPFMVQQSELFSAGLQKRNATIDAQINDLYRTVLGRKPAFGEIEKVIRFAKRRGLANTCRLLFNTNEFLFLD